MSQNKEKTKYKKAVISLLQELGFVCYDSAGHDGVRYIVFDGILCVHVDSRLTTISVFNIPDKTFSLPVETYNYNTRDYDEIKRKITDLIIVEGLKLL